MALTDITGLENRRIDQLSGGQRQRVALARAVAVRPSMLLLDEPLTALDAALRDRLRGELNRLLRTLGITTIYVTHDQAEAMALGDRIVVMRKGAIAQIGSAARASISRRRAALSPSSSAPPTFFRRPWRTDMLCFPEAACACRTAPPRVPSTAMLRPEAIAIVDRQGADLCGNVETVSFIGDRQRLTISGAADRPIMVEAPNSLAVEAGQRVGLGIEPRTVRLLPEDRR